MTAATTAKALGVELRGVRKEYESGVVAVHDIDLTVEAGEFVVLVGPSGCGKSTTLRMVAGLETISAGELRIGRRLVNDLPPAERDIAMVFQSYALYPHMTVRENLAFALKLRRRSPTEIAERVDAAAATLGLGALLDRTPKQLSGGQRQRVAIGRAIVREPSVFLFDEPLSNLDAALRSEMRRELAALHHRLAATMLYVTHDQVEAMTLGDRIVVMNKGRIAQVGTPAEVYRNPRDTFVASFVGSPTMNLLKGTPVRTADRLRVRLDGADGASVAVAADVAANVTSANVIAGVRPEDVRLRFGGEGDAQSLPAIVELVEPLGHEQLVHVRIGEAMVTVRSLERERPEIGARAWLEFDPGRIHLFDAETGRLEGQA